MFDPTKPVTNSPITSAELRNQFTGLKDLIDAIPPPVPSAVGAYANVSGSFGAVRQVAPDHDVLVMAEVDLESAGAGNAQVGAVLGPTDPPAAVSLATRTYRGTGGISTSLIFVVPRGQYYRLIDASSGTGSLAVLNDVWELPLN